MPKDPNLVYESPAPVVDIVTISAILVICPVAITFFLTHIKDLPILMSILILLTTLIIFSIGVSKITVEKDRFTITNRKFLLPRLTRTYTFPFNSVQEIKAWLPLSQFREVGDNVVDFDMQPFRAPRWAKSNTLIVKFKDGYEVTLTPSIYSGAFHKALIHIRDLSAIHLTMSQRQK